MRPGVEPVDHADYLTGRRRWIALGALWVFLLAGVALRLADDASWWAIVAAVVAIAVSAAMLHATGPGLLGCSIVVTTAVAIIGNETSSSLGWFTLCVLVAWCILGAGRLAGLIFWIGCLLLFGSEWLWADGDNGWGAWAAGVSFTALAAFLVRHEFALTTELRAAQAGLAERSRADERARIARELHDVIAHCLTVSLLHVSSARMSVELDDRAEAGRALAEAERLGRQSLDEVRATMGLLRAGASGESGSATERGIAPPAAGLNDLDELVDEFARAGLHIQTSIDGDPTGVAATTGSALYRIVQESLTNAARHAPGAAICVQLSFGVSASTLTIDSDGSPRAGSGLGLTGMRERAEAVGGTCTSGPAGTGWRVHAVVPTATVRLPR